LPRTLRGSTARFAAARALPLLSWRALASGFIPPTHWRGQADAALLERRWRWLSAAGGITETPRCLAAEGERGVCAWRETKVATRGDRPLTGGDSSSFRTGRRWVSSARRWLWRLAARLALSASGGFGIRATPRHGAAATSKATAGGSQKPQRGQHAWLAGGRRKHCAPLPDRLAAVPHGGPYRAGAVSVASAADPAVCRHGTVPLSRKRYYYYWRRSRGNTFAYHSPARKNSCRTRTGVAFACGDDDGAILRSVFYVDIMLPSATDAFSLPALPPAASMLRGTAAAAPLWRLF